MLLLHGLCAMLLVCCWRLPGPSAAAAAAAAAKEGHWVRLSGAALSQLALHPEEAELGRTAVKAVALPTHQVCGSVVDEAV